MTIRQLSLIRPVLACVSVVALSGMNLHSRSATAQESVPAPAQLLPVFHVQGGVYAVIGAQANSIVHLGAAETLVLDTQPVSQASALLETVRSITTKPIRYVVNTHVHPHNTGGNAVISHAGDTIGGNNATGIAAVGDATTRAMIIAHENVLTRMSAMASSPEPVPFDAWPTDAFVVPLDEIYNGEAVQLLHVTAAHTDGDVLAFFRRSDVIATGDVFSTLTYPVIDEEMGGSINGVIAALNKIIELAVPAAKQEGGTYVVPGRGRIADEADVVEYRDMVTIIRDRVRDMKDKGMTLAQVTAAQPTADYDPRYAAPEWTPDMFVEAVFRTLPPGERSAAP